MDWLILTSYFLWFFSPLSNPVVHIWLRLRGPQYSIHIAVPDVFEPPDIEQIDPSDFVERPVQMYSNPYRDQLEHIGDESKVDSNEAERQGKKKSPLFWIQLTKSFSIVAYDNPRTVYLHYERVYEGVNRVTWVNLNLASQLLWLVYLLCLAAGVVEMLAYTLCAGSVKFLHWLLGTIIGLCSYPRIEGSLRQLLPQPAHLEAVSLFRALQEIYGVTPVVDAQSLESDIVSMIQQKESARSSESDTNGAGDAPQQSDEQPDLDRETGPEDMSYDSLVELQLQNLIGNEKPYADPIADLNIQEINAPAKSAEIEAFSEIQVDEEPLQIEETEQPNIESQTQLELNEEPLEIQVDEIQTESEDFISVSDSSELSINMQESEELSMIEESEEFLSYIDVSETFSDNSDILEPEPEFSESSQEDVPLEPVENFHIEENETLQAELANLFTIPDSGGKPFQIADSEHGDRKQQDPEAQASLDYISASELSEPKELSMIKETDKEAESEDLISIVDCSETSAQIPDTFDYSFTEPLEDILLTEETFFMDRNDELLPVQSAGLQPTLEAAEEPLEKVNRDDIKDSTPASPDVVPFESEETFITEGNDDTWQEQFANLLKISNEDSFKAHNAAQEDDNWVSAVLRKNPIGSKKPLKIQEPEPAQARTDVFAGFFKELLKIEETLKAKKDKKDIEETNLNADPLNGVPTKSEESLFENDEASSELSMVQEIGEEAVSDDLISFVDCSETSSDMHENSSKLETRLAKKLLIGEAPQSDDDAIGNEVPSQTRQISEEILKLPETYAESELSMTTSEWSDLNIDMEEITAAPPLCFPNAPELKLPSGFYEQVDSTSIAGEQQPDDSIGPGVSPGICDVEFRSATDLSSTEDDVEFEPAAQQLSMTVAPQPYLSIPDDTRLSCPRAQQPAVPIWPGMEATQSSSEIAVAKLCSGTGPAVPIWANVPQEELSSASGMSLTESLQPASSISCGEFRSVTQLALPGPDLPAAPYGYTFMPVVDSRPAAGQQPPADLSSDIPDVELSVPAEVSLLPFEPPVGSAAKSRLAGQLNRAHDAEAIVPKWTAKSSSIPDVGTRAATPLSGGGVAQLDLPIAPWQSSFQPVARTSSATQLATRGSPESLDYTEDEFESFPNMPISSNESSCISGDEFHAPIVLSYLGIPQPDVGSHTSDAELPFDSRLPYPGVPEPVAPIWSDESLNVEGYDFDVENIGSSGDDLQEYIRSYEPAGSLVADVSPAVEPMSTESEQDVMETDDLENPDGTVQVTLFLPDGQPYVLDCTRLDQI